MATKVDTAPEYPWYSGNSRLEDPAVQGKWLAAHIAQIALIVFWVGLNTFSENQAFDTSLPMFDQGLVLIPHLAALGFGVGSGGVVTNTFVFTQIGAIHMVSSFVLFGGAYFHAKIGPAVLADGGRGNTDQFAFSWDDPKKLGYILGHHLVLIGTGALLFVLWIKFHGIYDPTIGEVRTVAAPGSTIGDVVLKYGWFTPGYNCFFVDNLEDLASGHLFIGLVDIAGGIFHINVAPLPWSKVVNKYTYSPDGLLGTAIGGLALMGFISAYFCAVNTLVYPVEFFGPALEVKFGIAPYFKDTADLADGFYTSRAWLANITYYLAFYMLQGHLYHTLKAMGFKFEDIPAVIARDTGNAPA
ncbi:chlorophyll a/b binding light-harvesting protein [Acaryochloris sp. CCMEE 5410]|uniref:chlorophyll a/b binding light-harvesting protein n=1 Tax=Acaryochloris sp. CCMEE 5410 TaxID=310037 RepID=UPI0002483E1D|nr:chlorophyll a/b binding light-harvesting protein [Acaryochloris sp. CCMEE 5410]KAI9131149.1 chlorophyll a/b binding light-harvesting protein [Acaryochloris sp. CCMEE 5410]